MAVRRERCTSATTIPCHLRFRVTKVSVRNSKEEDCKTTPHHARPQHLNSFGYLHVPSPHLQHRKHNLANMQANWRLERTRLASRRRSTLAVSW